MKTLPFHKDGIRIHSAFMLEFFCNQGRGVQLFDDLKEYTEPFSSKTYNLVSSCSMIWLSFLFHSLPRYPGMDTMPKNRWTQAETLNNLKNFIPCFDYREWDDPKKKENKDDSNMASEFAAEVTGGFYFDIEPCIRECPKLEDYFPRP